MSAGDAEALVVGGGPAGAAAAIALARAGRRVLLLEREAAPREVVCGEFLAADAAALLSGLGLRPAALGAVPIRRVLIGAGRRRASLPLPFAAWGLPRRALDAALLDAAEAVGVEVLRGRAVRGTARSADGLWRARLVAGDAADSATAPRLVLATGKHELRGHARSAQGGGGGGLRMGLKLHLRGVAAEAWDAVALLRCGRGGYAGLQPRPGGDGCANLCAALDPGAPGVAAAARDPVALLALVAGGSDLAARLLAGAEPAWDRPLAVAGIPYGFLHAPRPPADGADEPYRAGDQAAVIPSLGGDGVAMALASGLGAGAAAASGRSAAAWHAAWSRRAAGPMRMAGAVAMLLERAPGVLALAMEAAPWAARAAVRGMRVVGI